MSSILDCFCISDGRPYRRVFGLLTVFLFCSVGASVGLASPGEPAELDQDPALAGWWKFDDSTGKTVADSSSHGRKGQLMGEVEFDQASVSGPVGKALKLENPDDFVQITDYKGVTGAKPRTVSAWIKTDRARGEIVSWGKDDFGKMWIFRFIRGRVGVTPNGGYYYMADTTNDNAWHHVAAVVHEAELPNLHDDVTLYLDGEIAEIHRIGLLDLWPVETGDEQDVAIGKGFKGSIDDLRIYARALSDEEIKKLHGLGQ